jgi:hypothetical protein
MCIHIYSLILDILYFIYKVHTCNIFYILKVLTKSEISFKISALVGIFVFPPTHMLKPNQQCEMALECATYERSCGVMKGTNDAPESLFDLSTR